MSNQTKPTIGTPYYIVANWSGKGSQVYKVTWQNDFIDNKRLDEGRVHLNKKKAEAVLASRG